MWSSCPWVSITAPEPVAMLVEIGEVGDDVVHPGHLVVGEEQPAVDGHDVLARLDQHHVEADLAEATERDEAHRGLGGDIDGHGLTAECGAHGGPLRVSPGPRGTKIGGLAPGVF